MNKTNGFLFFTNMICLFFAINFLIKSCGNKHNASPVNLNNYSTIHSDTNITIQHITNTYVRSEKQLHPKDSTIVSEKTIDSSEIFRIWATKYIYQDNYKDSVLDLSVFDTLYQNRIIGRSVKYTANIQIKTITNIVQRKVGCKVGFIASTEHFAPSIIIEYKKIAFQTIFMLHIQQKHSIFDPSKQFQFGLFRKF